MMQKLTILSLASNFNAVKSFNQICTSLKKDGIKVELIGLSPYQWIPYEKDKISAEYEKKTNKIFELPNYFRKNQDLTKTSHRDQILKSYSQINDLIYKIVNKYKPDVFLTDGDRQLSIITSLLFKKYSKHKTVLMEHGFYFSDYMNIYQNTIHKKMIDIYRFFRYSIKENFDRHVNKMTELEIFLSHLKINLWGENKFSDYVCLASKKEKEVMEKFGVESKKLIVTGYPYVDELYKFTRLLKKTKSRGNIKKKILFISSGVGWWNKNDGIMFYERFLEARENLINLGYDVFLRLKPGEDVFSFLPKYLCAKLKKQKIKFDDNKIISYKSVLKYDLVIGDLSFMLLESVAVGKPIIIFENYPAKRYKIFIDEMWRKYLNARIIDNVDELIKGVSGCLSDRYIKLLQANFKENQDKLIGEYDGRATERMAKVVLQASSEA